MAEKVNKKAFEVVVDDKDKPLKLAVLRPNHRVAQQAQMVYSKSYIEACNAGVAVQDKMLRIIREQKLWDEEKQVRYEELVKTILEGEQKLKDGGKSGLTKKGARELSVKMRVARYEIRLLTAERNKYLANTAESFAEQAKFNYLVAACTVYSDTGKLYFKDTEDYLARDDADPVALKAANLMSTLAYPLDDDYERNLPENQFLLKYGFARDGDLHLIDPATKHAVNVAGKPVNDAGQVVNEQDQPIGDDGQPLVEEKAEFVEFLEDEPVVPATEAEVEPVNTEAEVAA